MTSRVRSEEVGRLGASDYCVVGSGPAGLTLARRLGLAGRDVVLVESGSARSDRSVQELNEGDVEGAPYAGLRATRHRGPGGTANIWNVETGNQPGAKYAPLARHDLADWPIAWAELERFYPAAQEVCGLGPFDYRADTWSTPQRRPFDLSGTGLENQVYQFGAARRFTRDLVDEVRGLENVRFVPSTTVVGLKLEGRRVRGVRAIDRGGAVVELAASTTILACGAIENARLLLLAAEYLPLSPWLGRGFMEHARDFSLELFPSTQEIFDDAGFYDQHPADAGVRVGGRIGISEEALRRYDLPNASLTLIPARSSRSPAPSLLDRWMRRVARMGGRAPRGRYGWSDVPDPARVFDRFRLVLNAEQRPDPRNRVELGARRDRFGTPLPILRLEWSARDQERLDALRGRLATWFADAGLGRLHFQAGSPADLSAHHHAGTTRLADRIEDGVVDPWGRVFGLENVHVAGASVFPSAGFANPTLTIAALSERLANHLLSV